MRRGWKIFWIICAVIAAVGFACCMTAMALGVTAEAIEERFPNGFAIVKNSDWHHSGNTYTGEVDESQTFSNMQIQEIDAHISGGELQVLQSDSDEIKIETSGIDSRLKLKYYVEDGELKIETKKHIWGINGGKHIGTVYLFVPKGYEFDDVSFEVGAGYLYVEDISANSLDIEVGAGAADVSSFHAGEASLDCGAGRITASGLADWEMDIDCGIGEIALAVNAKLEDYSYDIKCGIGQVDVGDEHFTGLGSKKTIEHATGKEINIDCGIGKVSVDFY
ncbi:DUF4097 family beta strand repeat-containing protein [Dorea sp. D27]|uniref:DUF4097 family beta strand repeat-containing protein n=1 Tax=Dorea sp. D27 TaxID=658665 RepID=UPI0006737AA8|nr:DUF4097 family beta strand repeat-containing protein [Dorea sp. D27]KMZ52485.1 hypothetical protein HMPREF0980_03424 [Dorea sp. D27]